MAWRTCSTCCSSTTNSCKDLDGCTAPGSLCNKEEMQNTVQQLQAAEETLSRSESLSLTPRRECQCSTYTETPTQQSVSNNTRPTPRTRVGALSRCHPGHRDTPVGPGRTPTVHRCPKGEAVGGPNTNATYVVRRSTEPHHYDVDNNGTADFSL